MGKSNECAFIENAPGRCAKSAGGAALRSRSAQHESIETHASGIRTRIFEAILPQQMEAGAANVEFVLGYREPLYTLRAHAGIDM